MKINKLLLNAEQFGHRYILAEIRTVSEYIDGKPSGNIKGYRYAIVLPEHNYERIDVIIDGALLIEHFDSPIEVELKGFSPYISWAGGDYSVAAHATTISPVGKTTTTNK